MEDSPDYEALFRKSEKKREEAETRRKEAETRRNEAENERDRLREETRPTNLAEFIQNCHEYLSEPLHFEMNASQSTGGSLTSPKGRLCPTYLRPWEDFHKQQQELYHEALQSLNSLEDPRLFASHRDIRDLGHRLCRRPLSSEADLQSYERFGVEDHVSDILEALKGHSHFRLANGVRFHNHANTFDDEPPLPESQRRKRSYPDQFCVNLKDIANTLLFIVEYKAEHKLTAENLRAGLKSMNFWEKVVQRPTIPIGGPEKLQYNAEQLSGSALTHAYDAMMHRGSAYGVVVTGNCLVFLHITEHEPETLHYFLAEPNLDVQAMSDQGDYTWMYTPVTAIGRLLALCLMSLDIPTRSQRWRSDKIPQLHTWEVDFETILKEIPDDEKRSTPPGSEYIPSSSPMSSFSESHHSNNRIGCRPGDVERSSPTDDSESDDVSGNKSVGARKRAKRALSQFSSSPPQRQHRPGQQYKRNNRTAPAESLEFCTESCLLGIKTRASFDENCPNVKLHRRDSQDCHSINCADMVCSLKQQLNNDMDNYCTPYGQPVGMGLPFKVTLMPYGYTLLGKGTTDRGWENLEWEAEVYHVLKPVQGSAVPVYLGTVHPNQSYFFEGVQIKHFLLSSWYGDRTDWINWNQRQWDIYQQTVQKIRRLGVHVGRVHQSNVFWDSQRRQARLVAFDRMKLVPRRHENRTHTKRSLAVHDDPPRKRVHAT
ncbi:hypothetical protein PISL3812_09932 [Talaromyces islandicus]|uniref:Uncharacterized protein n=1 Tax=Talaromyces islandicus TaxID=28573 RepID=A0A0U1MBE7_TALIS|nr:hypothetical protein PISL3812_09932 [Talaromyces islandicus]